MEPAFKAIVSAYGPIEGEVARLAESRALARLFAHGEVERVERHLGEGVKRWTIVERRVHGVPVEIRGRARLYEDPIAEVPAGGIVAIVFGQSPNEGLHITEPRDIGAIERALRCSSYSVPELVENRPYRRRNGRLAEIPPLGDQLFVAETHLCSQGLWLHLIGGKVVNVDGHADMDHVSGYEDNEPLETAMLAAIERLRRERKRSAPPHRKSPGGDRAPR